MLGQQPQPEPYGALAPVLFYGLAALTCLSAWAIVLSRNIVRMAVYLLMTLAGAAGLYFMLHAELLAAVQLIVYAGGTLILIVFGVMLTSKNPFAQLVARPAEMALAVAIALVIGAVLLIALHHSPQVSSPAPVASTQPVAAAGGYVTVEAVGHALLSTYLIPFEVAGVLLLVVMVGAAYMARRRAGEGSPNVVTAEVEGARNTPQPRGPAPSEL